MNKPTFENSPPAFGAQTRPLTDDVLQSAEEAVLSNPASVQSLQEGQWRSDVAAPATPSSWTESLARQVGEKPVQSALLALSTGALLMILIRSALQKRRS